MIDHDRLFKELLTTFFTDFVDLLLPELSSYLDPNSLVFLDKEVFTDVTEGERHEADVVVRARFRGQDSCFLVHVENQAQSQPEFARRMFRYFARLHEKHALPVYPVVVFSHDSTRPEAAHYEVTFPDLPVLRFQFRSVQLRRLNWRDYLRRPNPVAAALMARMGMSQEERPRVKLECLRLLTTLRLDAARLKLISGFIDTYLRLNREETLRFEREADTVLTTNEKATMLELTTSWKEEGLQEGLQQGRLEESLRLTLRLLQRRFGPLPAEIEARLRALSLEQAESLAEALLDFTSLTDLTTWLRAR
jgi:predicted transposase YdaD